MPEKDKISQSESIALSMVRVFAMALIVSCHVAQCYDLQIAWILNVGVQMFFFMSGFLYGKVDIPSSPFAFYKKRFVKVYLPYLFWVVLVVSVYAIFHLYKPNFWQMVLYLFNLQWFSTPIDGLNHLWFLTVLMVGYLLTPWVKRLLKKTPLIFISVFLICCVVEFLIVKKFYSFFAWVALYFMGLLYGSFYSKKLSNIVLAVSAVILIGLGTLYVSDRLALVDYRYFNIWLHWMLGLFLFVLLFRVLPHLVKSDKKYAAVLHFDHISYEVYLTHHPLILGPLSMMFITDSSWLNILLMLVAVYILSRILNLVSSFAKKVI